MFRGEREQKIQRMTTVSEATPRPWVRFNAQEELRGGEFLKDIQEKRWHAKTHASFLYHLLQLTPQIINDFKISNKYKGISQMMLQFMQEKQAQSTEEEVTLVSHVQRFDPTLFSEFWRGKDAELQELQDKVVRSIQRHIETGMSTRSISIVGEALVRMQFPLKNITPAELRERIAWSEKNREKAKSDILRGFESAFISRALSTALLVYAIDPDYFVDELMPLFVSEKVWATMRRELAVFKEKNQMLEYVELVHNMDRLSKMLDTTTGLPKVQTAKPISRAI